MTTDTAQVPIHGRMTSVDGYCRDDLRQHAEYGCPQHPDGGDFDTHFGIAATTTRRDERVIMVGALSKWRRGGAVLCCSTDDRGMPERWVALARHMRYGRPRCR
jgi:hypothetical protein